MIHLHDGTKRVLEEVKFVSSLKRNLISLSELEKKCCVFNSENGVLKVLRGTVGCDEGCEEE